MSRQKKLDDIKQLVERAINFQKEGNLEYSKKCYAKIILLFNELRSSDSGNIQIYNQKIQKYTNQMKRVEQLQKQRGKGIQQKSKFDFPIPKTKLLEEKIQIKGIHNNNNLIQNRQPMYKPDTQQQKRNKKIEVDPDIQGMIVRDIKLSFKDIVGMNDAKEIIQESIIKPRQRPDLFKGIRAPPKGILFYGPPGNGKTYIAKALASQSNCTFFAVSAAAIMNKWVGEAEKKLGKLFKTAQEMSPSIIFIDQIDSLLTARSQKQNQVSRRVKTQFLILMDGVMSTKQGDVLLIGATNLPSQLDIAALRRFNKLIYIGLPDPAARKGLVEQNLKGVKYDISNNEMKKLIDSLEGYSASQIKDIVKDAAMIPIRQISKSEFEKINQQKIRNVNLKDFLKVIEKRKPLLSKEDLKQYQANFT